MGQQGPKLTASLSPDYLDTVNVRNYLFLYGYGVVK